MKMDTNSPDFQELKQILRRGRYDYDHIAGIVYAACYKDSYVLQKILEANPQDVPLSEVEDGVSSDVEVSEEEEEEGNDDDDDDHDHDHDEVDVSPDNKKSKPAIQSGSKEDPVVLDDKENSSGKRKRARLEVEAESSEKKSKHSNTLLLCLNCGSNFNPNKNKEGACQFHPEESVLGELEDNPLDDQIHDDEESRETWPEAFQWECCETNLDVDEPCETGWHRAEGAEKTEYSRRRERESRRRKYFG